MCFLSDKDRDNIAMADSQSSNSNTGRDNIAMGRSTIPVSPIFNVNNHNVLADMRIVNPLWSRQDDDDDLEEPTPPSHAADPSKYLVDVPVMLKSDPQAEFTPVVSRSKKKKLRQKAAKAARAERNVVLSKGGPRLYT